MARGQGACEEIWHATIACLRRHAGGLGVTHEAYVNAGI